MTTNEKCILDLEENANLCKFFVNPKKRRVNKLLNSPYSPLLLIPLGAIYFMLMYILS